jgi:TonB family protein
MSAQPVPATEGSIVEETANDQLKKGWENWFWGSMMAAIAVHFALFALWPDMTAEDVAFDADELTAIDIPPEVEIPPPPEAIQRPATPVIAEAQIDEEITIAPTTFEDNPVEMLPPPPDATTNTGGAGPRFIPYDVQPVLQNRREVGRVLEREYPPLLKESGIGGVVNVWLYIDEQGNVADREVNQSSGYDALDAAALEVADVMQFSPAQNRDKVTAVWVSIPITFTVGR